MIIYTLWGSGTFLDASADYKIQTLTIIQCGIYKQILVTLIIGRAHKNVIVANGGRIGLAIQTTWTP